MYFILLFCLIAVAGASNTMFNIMFNENRHSRIVPDLKENAFSFSLVSVTVATDLLNMAFIMLRYVLSVPICWEFYHKWVLDFVQSFFCIYWHDHMIFIFLFVYAVYHMNWFVDIESTLYHRNKSHLIMVNDIFNVLLDLVCSYFVEEFYIYVHQGYWPIVSFLCSVFVWF